MISSVAFNLSVALEALDIIWIKFEPVGRFLLVPSFHTPPAREELPKIIAWGVVVTVALPLEWFALSLNVILAEAIVNAIKLLPVVEEALSISNSNPVRGAVAFPGRSNCGSISKVAANSCEDATPLSGLRAPSELVRVPKAAVRIL